MADRLAPHREKTVVEEEDDQVQHAILALLLYEHPGQRSIDEVVREMTDQPERVVARDAIVNALRDLVAAGLLHRNGQFVFATRAAVRFDELAL
jgi:hypothetical protein